MFYLAIAVKICAQRVKDEIIAVKSQTWKHVTVANISQRKRMFIPNHVVQSHPFLFLLRIPRWTGLICLSVVPFVCVLP